MRPRTSEGSGGSRRVRGVRQYLIEREYETAWDPRYDPPKLERTLLDPLEAGEPVELDAWQLPGETNEIIAEYGGLYAVVRVDADDVVTVIAPADNPLGFPRGEDGASEEQS